MKNNLSKFCLGFLILTSQIFGNVADPNFTDVSSETTKTEPYKPQQAFAAIRNRPGLRAGCVSALITKNTSNNYQCELRYFKPDANGIPTSIEVGVFDKCSDAAVVTTNMKNFNDLTASVNTYLIVTNYGVNQIRIYKLSINQKGNLTTVLEKAFSVEVFSVPPNLAGFVPGFGQIATYLYAAADRDSDQLGFILVKDEDTIIGLKKEGKAWSFNASFFDAAFESYDLFLSGSDFLLTISYTESLDSRAVGNYKIIDEAIDSDTVVGNLLSFDQEYPVSPLNTVDYVKAGNSSYMIYRAPNKTARVYKVNQARTLASLYLSIANTESVDVQALQAKIETMVAKNSTDGKNGVVTDFEDASKNFEGKASEEFDNDSKSNFASNVVVKIKLSIGNLGKGIVVWIEKARTTSGRFVSILAYMFLDKTSTDNLEKDSEVVYSTPTGDDTASKQLNMPSVEATSIPDEALTSNTEVKDVDAITLPSKEGETPAYMIQLITYLKNSKTYSVEYLSGNADDSSLSTVDALIKLIDTYTPIKVNSAF